MHSRCNICQDLIALLLLDCHDVHAQRSPRCILLWVWQASSVHTCLASHFVADIDCHAQEFATKADWTVLVTAHKAMRQLTDAVAMPIAFHRLPVAAYTGAATITPCSSKPHSTVAPRMMLDDSDRTETAFCIYAILDACVKRTKQGTVNSLCKTLDVRTILLQGRRHW